MAILLRHFNLSLEVYGDVIIEEQPVSTIPNLFFIFVEIFFTLLNPLYLIKQMSTLLSRRHLSSITCVIT